MMERRLKRNYLGLFLIEELGLKIQYWMFFKKLQMGFMKLQTI